MRHIVGVRPKSPYRGADQDGEQFDNANVVAHRARLLSARQECAEGTLQILLGVRRRAVQVDVATRAELFA